MWFFFCEECGISIANPDENDKSPWKCFIGVDDENGEMKTLGAIVDGTDPKETKTEGLRKYFFISLKFFFAFFVVSFAVKYLFSELSRDTF